MTSRKRIRGRNSEESNNSMRISSDADSSDSDGDSCKVTEKTPPKKAKPLPVESDSAESEPEHQDSSQTKSQINNNVTVSFPSCMPQGKDETEDEGTSDSHSEGGDDVDEDNYDSSDSFVDDENADESTLATPPESPEDFVPPDPGMYMTAAVSEGEEDEDEILYGKKLSESQVSSMCKLDLDTIDAALHHARVLRGKSLEQKIQWIVDEYNGTNDADRNIKPTPYEKTQIKKPPKVDRRDAIHFKGKSFKSLLYVQEIRKGIPFLTDFGVRKSSAVIHSVVFHFRGGDESGEIFAVTTGAAWTVVEKFCDFSFVTLVAARLLSEKGSVESTKKGLVGNEVQSRKVHKSAQEENPFDLVEFCTNYTAEFRPTASLFKLSRFQRNRNEYEQPDTPESEVEERQRPSTSKSAAKVKSSPQKPSRKCLYQEVPRMKVIVNLRSIRIQCKLSASDRLSILDMLSSIVKGEKSLNIYGEEEVDSSAHVKYLTPVDTVTSKELTLELSRMVHDALSDRSAEQSKLDELLNFQLIYKHFTRFLSGRNFQLYKKTLPVKDTPEEWIERPPTLKEVALALRKTDLVNLDTVRRGDPEKVFFKRLDNIKIKFMEYPSEKLISDKLLNMIDGLVVSGDGSKVYWHVQGRWTLLGSVYILTVHQEVMKFVRNSMVHSGTSDSTKYALPQPWPPIEQIEGEDIEENGSRSRYSRRFIAKILDKMRNEPDIFIPEGNFNLFDFIRCVPQPDSSRSGCTDGEISNVTIYFIIPSLNYEVVETALQISNAVIKIRKAAFTGKNKKIGGSEVILKELETIYRDLSRRYGRKDAFTDLFPDINGFVAALAEATICIAVGKGVNSQDVGRHIPLERLSQFPENITVQFLQDIMMKQAERDPELTEDLERAFGLAQRDDDYHSLSKNLLKEFKRADFVTRTGKITGKLLSITKTKFKFPERHLPEPLRQFIYECVIEDLQARGFTLLARLAFIQLERTLHQTGCSTSSIKIVDIE